MATIITVCNTCKREGWDPELTPDTDGETLFRLISAAAEDHPEIAVQSHSCLMGCDFSCNIALQSVGKLTYTLGTFEPQADAATDIVGFAKKYDDSDSGQVPYREWPIGVKGHFRSRIPPMPKG